MNKVVATGAAPAAAAAAAAADVMDMDMGAMTEEQQLEWALRMSMQVGIGRVTSGTLKSFCCRTLHRRPAALRRPLRRLLRSRWRREGYGRGNCSDNGEITVGCRL